MTVLCEATPAVISRRASKYDFTIRILQKPYREIRGDGIRVMPVVSRYEAYTYTCNASIPAGLVLEMTVLCEDSPAVISRRASRYDFT